MFETTRVTARAAEVSWDAVFLLVPACFAAVLAGAVRPAVFLLAVAFLAAVFRSGDFLAAGFFVARVLLEARFFPVFRLEAAFAGAPPAGGCWSSRSCRGFGACTFGSGLSFTGGCLGHLTSNR